MGAKIGVKMGIPGEGHVGGSFEKKRFCRDFISILSSRRSLRKGEHAILLGFSPKNGAPEGASTCDMVFFPGFKRGSEFK